MRLLEQRLEEVEAAAAQREAEELLGVGWVFLCLSAAAVVLLLAACGWQRSLLALAAFAVVTRHWVSNCSERFLNSAVSRQQCSSASKITALLCQLRQVVCVPAAACLVAVCRAPSG